MGEKWLISFCLWNKNWVNCGIYSLYLLQSTVNQHHPTIIRIHLTILHSQPTISIIALHHIAHHWQCTIIASWSPFVRYTPSITMIQCNIMLDQRDVDQLRTQKNDANKLCQLQGSDCLIPKCDFSYPGVQECLGLKFQYLCQHGHRPTSLIYTPKIA